MLPKRIRWARFGPTNRSWMIHVPGGGVCLSAFVLGRGPRGSVLMGRPRAHPAWPEHGGLALWRAREIEKSGEWVLPATHLKMDETPEAAALRIARGFTGLRGARPRFLRVESHHRPSVHWVRSGGRRIRLNHWDLCFVFEVGVRAAPKPPAWWSELRLVPQTELRRLKIGRAHRDLLV